MPHVLSCQPSSNRLTSSLFLFLVPAASRFHHDAATHLHRPAGPAAYSECRSPPYPHPRLKPVVRQLLIQAKYVCQLSGLRIRGLMVMAPIVADPEQTRPIFASLARLRDVLSPSLELALPELSMGMTDDYAVAIEEGATMIRIGRAIFGERG